MWLLLLDWAVVAIPTVLGLIAWIVPIRQATSRHRWTLFAGGLLMSGLIFLQQYTARNERAREVAMMPTKKDIPTAGDIVKELLKVLPPERKATRWELTDDELLKLSQRLAPYADASPKQGDLIMAVLGNQDSARFAQRLVAAFRAAQWRGVGGTGYGQGVFGGPVEGIIIKLHGKNDRPPGLKEFVDTLREGGIEPVGELDPANVPQNEFRIIVGARPS